MLFSIIVPIYDVEEHLERCVESLVNQTYKDIEIILVDDESPDNCPEICERYAKRDNRISVIHKKNGGLSDARNAGLKIAKGKYVIFVDADDYIELESCEKMATVLLCEDIDVMIGDAWVEGGTANMFHVYDKFLYDSGEEYLVSAFKNGNPPMSACLNIYNRAFLIDNSLFFKYGILHEDEQFTPRVFLKARKILCSRIKFYHYVIRDNSITTHIDKRKNLMDFYSTGLELENIYQKIGNDNLKKMMRNAMCDTYLSIFWVGKLHKYGNEFVQKQFLKRNAFRIKTKIKVALFCFNPTIYYWINYLNKKMRIIW